MLSILLVEILCQLSFFQIILQVLLPDNLHVPILINPDQERGAKINPESLMHAEQGLTDKGR